MHDGALIDGVVRINYLRGGKLEEGVYRDEDNANRITMNGTSPLKVMICSDKKGGLNVSFPKGGKGAVVGLMN